MSSSPNRIVKNTFFFLWKNAYYYIFHTLYYSFSSEIIRSSRLWCIWSDWRSSEYAWFLSASMAATTQRFMSYSEGTGNLEDKRQVFNVSVILHFIIAICACLLLCSFFIFVFR